MAEAAGDASEADVAVEDAEAMAAAVAVEADMEAAATPMDTEAARAAVDMVDAKVRKHRRSICSLCASLAAASACALSFSAAWDAEPTARRWLCFFSQPSCQ
jgi:hypothetical protein